MAVRRKAPVVLATVLTLAVAGTALASVRGTTLKMGLSNVLTGNYITSFAATVLNAPAFIIRNNSTTAASSALRVWAPYGGTPLELFAKAGNPVMKLSNAVKITNLNADQLDNKNSDIGEMPNTIAARDASGNLTANTFYGNLSGNANTATNAGFATTAGNANTVGGRAPNALTRVGQGGSGDTTEIPTDGSVVSYGTVTISAPTAGFVMINAGVTIYNSACADTCLVLANLHEQGTSSYGIEPTNLSLTGLQRSAGPLNGVFVASAGTHTYEIILQRTSASGTLYGYWASMTALFSPFGSTGGGTLGTASSRGHATDKGAPAP
jgi:hypothetical protein